jgi:hypothetical protein
MIPRLIQVGRFYMILICISRDLFNRIFLEGISPATRRIIDKLLVYMKSHQKVDELIGDV